VVRGFEYAKDPKTYTSGSVATGRASLADAGSSVIGSDLKHRANDARDGSSSYEYLILFY
jgi:hypothetical protein